LEGLRSVFFEGLPVPVSYEVGLGRGSEVEDFGIPHLAKNERDTPNFLHAAADKTACAPFIKERRMKFIEVLEPYRKSGMWGTRACWQVTVQSLNGWFWVDGLGSGAVVYWSVKGLIGSRIQAVVAR
jgi:hypothetical protein